MGKKLEEDLGKRERQILEAVYRLGEASVADVLGEILEAPGYSSVRATMNNLVRKGRLAHRKEGKRFVYRPAIDREKARRSAMKRLLRTYFENSAASAVSLLLTTHGGEITEDEYQDLRRLIESKRRRNHDPRTDP